MKQLLINLLCKLLGIAKALFIVVGPALGDALLRILNDAKYQRLAIEACKRSAELGLANDAAWNEARKRFVSSLGMIGAELANHVVDTILQNAYTYWKNSTNH